MFATFQHIAFNFLDLLNDFDGGCRLSESSSESLSGSTATRLRAPPPAPPSLRLSELLPKELRFTELLPKEFRFTELLPKEPRFTELLPIELRFAELLPIEPRSAKLFVLLKLSNLSAAPPPEWDRLAAAAASFLFFLKTLKSGLAAAVADAVL